MATSRKVQTSKLQLTVDTATERLLQDITALGVHGTTKAEVAVSILRNWLWENQEKLRDNGIRLAQNVPPQSKR